MITVITILSSPGQVSSFLHVSIIPPQSVVGLRVLALNTWGMPAKVGSEDKELRMKVAPCPSPDPPLQAIGEYIQKAEYDVYLLAELWMRPDHATIKALIPKVSSNNSFSSLLFFVADLVLYHVHLHFTLL